MNTYREVEDRLIEILQSCSRKYPKLELTPFSTLDFFEIDHSQIHDRVYSEFEVFLENDEIEKCSTIRDLASVVFSEVNRPMHKKRQRRETRAISLTHTYDPKELNTREEVECEYKNFMNELSAVSDNIKALKTQNKLFVPLRNFYVNQLEEIIADANFQLESVLKYAIWDKLVIAFIGITNAGKSTIIETFRILFNENERKKALEKCRSGVDGAIIGDGRNDFTKVYKEYNMQIGGKEFILIDVPGIEGKENAVKTEIQKALGKAHCVFYVQGEGKKPDVAIVEKIKVYLKDWVKVYSIYNVKGTAFNYDEVCERNLFRTPEIIQIEKQIDSTMHGALGNNYAGDITVQARLGLCSYAKFATNQTELKDDQTDLLKSFGTADAMFKFSNFKEVTGTVGYLAEHFSDEILDAQRKKLFKLHLDAYKKLVEATNKNSNNIKRTIDKFETCKNNIHSIFKTSKKMIESEIRGQIVEMFDVLEEEGCEYIDAGYEGDDFINIINSEKDRISSILENKIKIIIENEASELRKKIFEEIQKLKEKSSKLDFEGDFSTNFSVDLDNVIGELELGLGDFVNWAAYLGSCWMVGWTIAAGNWWNPIGWGIGAILAAVSIFGNSKRKKAKAKLREKIAEAKKDFFLYSFNQIINNIVSQFSSKTRDFDSKINPIIADFKKLRNSMEKIQLQVKKDAIRYK